MSIKCLALPAVEYHFALRQQTVFPGMFCLQLPYWARSDITVPLRPRCFSGSSSYFAVCAHCG